VTADRRCGAETLITAERTPSGALAHLGKLDANRQEFLFRHYVLDTLSKRLYALPRA
jgi:hypothetical protein